MRKNSVVFIIPIFNRVVFPFQTVRIRLNETNQYNGRVYNNLVGVFPLFDNNPEKGTNKSEDREAQKDRKDYIYGTIVKITAEDKVLSIVGSSQQLLRSISGVGIARFRVPKAGLPSPVQGRVDNVEIIKDEITAEKENELRSKGIVKQLKDLAVHYIENLHSHRNSAESIREYIMNEQNIPKLLFYIFSILNIDTDEQYRLLTINDIDTRINEAVATLKTLINSIQIANELETKTQEKMKNERKNYILKQKLDELNKMLYGENAQDEMSKLDQTIKEANLPPVVRREVENEYRRLKSLQPHHAEYNVILTYIKTVLDLPWNTASEEVRDVKKAKEILDRDHAGLEKVKKRIIEYLAVRNLKGNSKGTIICLSGPPGVGKTSLGKSIAESLGRKFERVALGGVRDEAEIRGHRRTYVGALPGVLVSALKRCKTNNPVILLDEIDKLGRDFRGDPSSALLEVLDPAQNHNFVDHYLGVPFDLSNVFFIATANKLDTIQPALLDRLEIIQIPGYTFHEKVEIARKYLVPKQVAENGIKAQHIEITQEAMHMMINSYTREAGVRELERVIASVCRKVAVKYSDYISSFSKKEDSDNSNPEVGEGFEPVKVTEEMLQEFLGPPIFDEDIRDRISTPGVATGMAWTAAGGKILYVETSFSRGRGKIEITGQLGDVMKESVLTAIGWIKSNFHSLHIDTQKLLGAKTSETVKKDDKKSDSSDDPNNLFDKIDLYIHFPAAAIPKDGPSAGVTIVTALVSLLSNRRVKSNLSMTGEISLKGLVLPVGGIKEKCIAAHSGGIRNIILPKKNQRDIDEISSEIKKDIHFTFVRNIEEVLKESLESKEHTFDPKLSPEVINKQSRL